MASETEDGYRELVVERAEELRVDVEGTFALATAYAVRDDGVGFGLIVHVSAGLIYGLHVHRDDFGPIERLPDATRFEILHRT